jgi:hypothetical protein
MFIVGGKREELLKAAAKRRAKERQEAKIDDPVSVRDLHREALSIARYFVQLPGQPDIILQRVVDGHMLERLAPITHDLDAEMGELGRYQSSRLKQPKGERRQIIDRVILWGREKKPRWAISARRVKECSKYYRRMERLGLFPPLPTD